MAQFEFFDIDPRLARDYLFERIPAMAADILAAFDHDGALRPGSTEPIAGMDVIPAAGGTWELLGFTWKDMRFTVLAARIITLGTYRITVAEAMTPSTNGTPRRFTDPTDGVFVLVQTGDYGPVEYLSHAPDATLASVWM